MKLFSKISVISLSSVLLAACGSNGTGPRSMDSKTLDSTSSSECNAKPDLPASYLIENAIKPISVKAGSGFVGQLSIREYRLFKDASVGSYSVLRIFTDSLMLQQKYGSQIVWDAEDRASYIKDLDGKIKMEFYSVTLAEWERSKNAKWEFVHAYSQLTCRDIIYSIRYWDGDPVFDVLTESGELFNMGSGDGAADLLILKNFMKVVNYNCYSDPKPAKGDFVMSCKDARQVWLGS